jgi:AraC-like DNA-binding protein
MPHHRPGRQLVATGNIGWKREDNRLKVSGRAMATGEYRKIKKGKLVMIYIEHSPTNQLSSFIDKIWYCKADNLTATSLTIPLPNHELVFNFSEAYRIKKVGDTEFTIENPRAWVNGLQSKAYFSYSEGKHEMVGVLFKSNGLKAFLKYHSSEFMDHFIDANLVLGNTLQNIIQQIQNAALIADKFNLLEAFLLKNLAVNNSPAYLNDSISKISKTLVIKGGINDICNKLSISNKSLIEAFKKHVGVSPVKYSHLQLINNALFLLSKEPKQSFTKLAYRLNFYDQSHFINLFKSITSLTPSQYSNFVTNSQVDETSPNFIFLEG